jgi:hypothetical protein
MSTDETYYAIYIKNKLGGGGRCPEQCIHVSKCKSDKMNKFVYYSYSGYGVTFLVNVLRQHQPFVVLCRMLLKYTGSQNVCFSTRIAYEWFII